MRKIFVCFLTIGLLLSGCFHKEVVDLSGEKAVVEQTKFDEFLKQEFTDTLAGSKLSAHFSVEDLGAYGLEDMEVSLGTVEAYDFEALKTSISSMKSFNRDLLTENQKSYYDRYLWITCYMNEVGNVPKKGEVLSWAESSAVVYANSVLGARCNRNSGIMDIMGSIVGFVPHFGLLTDEGRKASWVVEIKTTKKPEAQLLGSAIGMKVMEDVPYVKGLDKWLSNELTDENRSYLKDFGAATASNGAVGLYHIENLTPEAKEAGKKLIKKDAKVYVIDDAELQRVYNSYPVIWKNKNAKPKLCFMGCPHMSMEQLVSWTNKLEYAFKDEKKKKVKIPTVFTTSPAVLKEFNKTEYSKKLKDMGVIVSYICPLMYMNNPLCGKMPVITSSNKLRTYTTARYYTDDEILTQITKGGK